MSQTQQTPQTPNWYTALKMIGDYFPRVTTEKPYETLIAWASNEVTPDQNGAVTFASPEEIQLLLMWLLVQIGGAAAQGTLAVSNSAQFTIENGPVVLQALVEIAQIQQQQLSVAQAQLEATKALNETLLEFMGMATRTEEPPPVPGRTRRPPVRLVTSDETREEEEAPS